MALEDTKRIYGTGITIAAPYLWQVDQWVSLYAAREASGPQEDDFVLLAGDDEEFLGTFKVVSVGTETDGPLVGDDFIEIDRTENFSDRVEVRWVRHAEPETSPSVTSGGGRELAQTYVRGRLYHEVPEQVGITIPWGSSPNPLLGVGDLTLPDEPSQILFSTSPLDVLDVILLISIAPSVSIARRASLYCLSTYGGSEFHGMQDSCCILL